MEWNGRPLGNKSAEDVHDIIQETSGDLQVELRVSRLVMGSATDPRVPLTAATDLRYPGGGAAGAGAVVGGRVGGARASTDPLAAASRGMQVPPGTGGTRIQVGIEDPSFCCRFFYQFLILIQLHFLAILTSRCHYHLFIRLPLQLALINFQYI